MLDKYNSKTKKQLTEQSDFSLEAFPNSHEKMRKMQRINRFLQHYLSERQVKKCKNIENMFRLNKGSSVLYQVATND